MIVDRDILAELAVLRREHQQLVQANEWWRWVAPPADAIGVASAGKSGPPIEERPPVRSGVGPGP